MEIENNGREKNTLNKNIQLSEIIQGVGHTGSVECLDTNPIDQQLFCSGGFDAQTSIWKLTEQSILGNAQKLQTGTKKKVKLDSKELSPIQSTKYHTDYVSNIIWAQPEMILTGSFDHTVKMYDVKKNFDFQNINCKDSVITALAYSQNLLLVGHEDAYIKLFDLRSENKTTQQIYKSHNIWVSGLKFHPNNSNIFISSAYDNQIKIWDLRSNFPLFSLKSHTNKVFSLDWNGENHIISGGSDSQIFIHTFNQN